MTKVAEYSEVSILDLINGPRLKLRGSLSSLQKEGVNLTVQDLLRQDARIQDLYFNISELKLSNTSLRCFQSK